MVSCYDRLEGKKRVPAGTWIRAAHARKRLGVDLDSFPEAMVNAVAWSKTYRREFWDRAGLRFPEGKIYEDQPVSAAAFAQARAFDVVPDISVSWRIRNDRSSISQSAWSTRNLEAHNDAVAASFEALRAAGKDRAVEIRALQLISYNMPFFTRHLVKGGPEFWALLREALLDLVHRVSREEFVHSVGRPGQGARRADRERPARRGGRLHRELGQRRPPVPDRGDARGHPGRAAADRGSPRRRQHPLRQPARAGEPADARGLGRRHGSPSRAGPTSATSTSWRNPPEFAVELVSADGATRIPLEVELFDEPRLDVLGAHWHCNYRPGGWRARIPPTEIPADVEQDWSFEITMTAGGRHAVRRGSATSRWRARRPCPRPTSTAAASTRTVMRGAERQIAVRVAARPAYAVSQEQLADGTDERRVPRSGPRQAWS